MPEEIVFQTKPQIALAQVARALGHGVRVFAWTFDELYGRDGRFLDGLDGLDQFFVCEVPCDFHGWVERPRVVLPPAKTAGKRGRKRVRPRVARRRPSCEARNLLAHSPVFRDQSWQSYHTHDTDRGPVVWEVKHADFWRKDADGLPGRPHTLLVARNVLTGEVKYFLANRGWRERHPTTREQLTLRDLLRVAFSRWPIESCFRETKEELGFDHYEVRGWRCVHRHFYVTQLSHLFCARVRQALDTAPEGSAETLSIEQVRSAIDVWLSTADLPPRIRLARYQHERDQQDYYQRRNEQARKSHTKTRRRELKAHGIDVDHLKSCRPKSTATHSSTDDSPQ